jgi:DNA-binding GntR family transcriptional regulator
MANARELGDAEESLGALAQESLSRRVMEAFSDQILSGRLVPGQRVDLGFYASKWEVSITPVRDAAKQLEALGFLKVLPRRGVFVAELSAKEVKDIFDLRTSLETTAVRLATPRIPKAEAERALQLYIKAGEAPPGKERLRLLPKVDLLIHTLALTYCDNPRLQKMMEGMRDLVKWCQSTIILKLNEPFMTTLPEHIAICEAVCARDPERAAAAMQTHLNNTSERIQAFLREESRQKS